MAVSKFAIACVAAVLAGGASASISGSDGAPPEATQTSNGILGTPVYAIHQPHAMFRDTPVQFVSGKTFAHVVNVATDDAGHATRVQVALDDMPAQKLWLDEGNL